MNDITAILAQIEKDAGATREEILAAARQNAEDIRAQGAKEAADEAARILADADRQVEALRQRGESQIDIQGRNTRLAARRAMIDQTFVRAMELLCAQTGDEKVKLYTRLAAENLADGETQLVLSREDTAIGTRVLEEIKAKKPGANVTLSSQEGKFRGGIVLRQGDIETNCTFEVLVAGIKEQLEAQVAAVLFE